LNFVYVFLNSLYFLFRVAIFIYVFYQFSLYLIPGCNFITIQIKNIGFKKKRETDR
jgi:hypothetical protein